MGSWIQESLTPRSKALLVKSFFPEEYQCEKPSRTTNITLQGNFFRNILLLGYCTNLVTLFGADVSIRCFGLRPLKVRGAAQSQRCSWESPKDPS